MVCYCERQLTLPFFLCVVRCGCIRARPSDRGDAYSFFFFFVVVQQLSSSRWYVTFHGTHVCACVHWWMPGGGSGGGEGRGGARVPVGVLFFVLSYVLVHGRAYGTKKKTAVLIHVWCLAIGREGGRKGGRQGGTRRGDLSGFCLLHLMNKIEGRCSRLSHEPAIPLARCRRAVRCACANIPPLVACVYGGSAAFAVVSWVRAFSSRLGFFCAICSRDA